MCLPYLYVVLLNTTLQERNMKTHDLASALSCVIVVVIGLALLTHFVGASQEFRKHTSSAIDSA
jgi:hypothetical protein